MNKRVTFLIGALLLAALPYMGVPDYYLHVLILMLIWSFIYTSWSLMGRFGLVSLGHGAFLGVGAYAVVLMWKYLGLTPWIGIPLALLFSLALAILIGYPCFKFRITGHYFALVTLALSEVISMLIMALRDTTGGSLGVTPNRFGEGTSIYALQFGHKQTFYWIALVVWIAGIWVWKRVDVSMERHALDAISEDEDAAASVGIHVTRQKLRITVISAMMTAFGGILYCQYQMYINPHIVSGVGVSLQIVFAVVAGGMYVAFGPTVGAIITISLAEFLRVLIGINMVGLDNTIYGLMLILFIIFLPQGVLGAIIEKGSRKKALRNFATAMNIPIK
ncbi:MAG: branched-chain amino acid ABC transporter permease [Desulfobacteraceae bacterium]|nr:branched-chain amino acid ABC transporter permease [Desulfobacteraceae bacterium]